MAVETEGLTHVHLVVRDVHRSLAFYREVFGMEVRFWDGDRTVFIRTPGRHDTITLRQPDISDRAGDGGGIEHIGFRLVDPTLLDDAIAQVEQAGGRLLDRGEHAPGRPFAYVTDPDGYVIEL